MEGKKLDNGKVRPSLVLGDMANAILAVSEVAAFGAAKYSDGNWLLVEGAISDVDSESGLLHAAHEAWNALVVLELKLRSKKVFNVTEEAMVKESLGRAVLRASEEAKIKNTCNILYNVPRYTQVKRRCYENLICVYCGFF